MAGIACDPHAPFAGRPHTHMTEAQMAAHRRRPFPEEFIRSSNIQRARIAQRATETARVNVIRDERHVKSDEPVVPAKKGVRRGHRS